LGPPGEELLAPCAAPLARLPPAAVAPPRAGPTPDPLLSDGEGDRGLLRVPRALGWAGLGAGGDDFEGKRSASRSMYSTHENGSDHFEPNAVHLPFATDGLGPGSI